MARYKFSKEYSTKSSAKRALKRIFAVGPYSNDFTHASAKFTDGYIWEEAGKFTLTLSSNYFSEMSLKRAFKVGIDQV